MPPLSCFSSAGCSRSGSLLPREGSCSLLAVSACQRADGSLCTWSRCLTSTKGGGGKRGLREQESRGRAKSEGERKRRDGGTGEGEKEESGNGQEREFHHSWLTNCMHRSLLLVRISDKHTHSHLYLYRQTGQSCEMAINTHEEL